MPEGLEARLAREKNEALDYTRDYAPALRVQGSGYAVVELAFGAGEILFEPLQVGPVTLRSRVFASAPPVRGGSGIA